VNWFMILCDDAPGSAAIRAAQRPAHLAHLQALADQQRLLLAGPRPVDATTPLAETPIIGSLIIGAFETLGAAEAWAAEDPYAQAGLFQQVRVEAFVKVLP
jgi:uncharacterized protein